MYMYSSLILITMYMTVHYPFNMQSGHTQYPLLLTTTTITDHTHILAWPLQMCSLLACLGIETISGAPQPHLYHTHLIDWKNTQAGVWLN